MLREILDNFDRLRGCSPRSIQALEAAWPKDAPVKWPEAYMMAKERASMQAFDRHDGCAANWLEGMLAAFKV